MFIYAHECGAQFALDHFQSSFPGSFGGNRPIILALIDELICSFESSFDDLDGLEEVD